MTDVDRSSLDRILPATPGSPDWDDVLRRSGARHVGRRRRFVVLAAAVLVVAVGTASAIGGVRAFFLDRGLVGLPPVGATPSAPETGELVIAAYVFSAEVGRTNVWAYSDGRLISRPQGKGPSGWVEQRLTADGVERLRSEITSTGLFGNDRKLSFDGGPYGQPCFSFVRVRNGDPLVSVTWTATQVRLSSG
jgi:hypothetical protein